MLQMQIYPSDYGLEQMGKEECLGPVQLKDDENENSELEDKGNIEVRSIKKSNLVMSNSLPCAIVSSNVFKIKLICTKTLPLSS